MRKPIYQAALALTAAALSVVLGATASLAATKTWTVSPGGSISAATGATTTTTLTDVTTGLTITCTSSSLTGSLESGSGLKGAGIGTVTSLALNNCTALGQTGSLSTGTVSWPMSAKAYNSATGVTQGTISGIHWAVSVSLCSFVLDGTSATADNGTVRFMYTNRTHVLKIVPKTGGLTTYNESNCFGHVGNGDTVTVTTHYKVSPHQLITSP